MPLVECRWDKRAIQALAAAADARDALQARITRALAVLDTASRADLRRILEDE